MDRQVIIFVSILLIIVSAVYAVFVANLVPWPLFFLGLLVIAVVAFLFPEIRQFPEYKRGVVFRLGKFRSVVGPGISIIFPRFEQVVEVDLRTQTVDIEPQTVITQDNLKIKIDAVVYLRVVDPKKSVIEVKDWQQATRLILPAVIRDAIAKLSLEDVITKSTELNELISMTFKKTSAEWGILTYKVEIESIDLPDSLTETLKKKREALERKVEVEINAQAKKVELEILEQAMSKMGENTLTYLYLESLKQISEGKSTKIIFPMEFSNLLGVISNKLGKKDAKKEGKELIDSVIATYLTSVPSAPKDLAVEKPASEEKKPEAKPEAVKTAKKKKARRKKSKAVKKWAPKVARFRKKKGHRRELI